MGGRPPRTRSLPLLPRADHALVVRTHYSDEARWQILRDAIVAPYGEFQASVHFVEGRAYRDASLTGLLAAASNMEESFFIVADAEAVETTDHPLLVVDLDVERGRTFRVVPACLAGVQANLSLANIDFDEFVQALDPDGVLRGFG